MSRSRFDSCFLLTHTSSPMEDTLADEWSILSLMEAEAELIELEEETPAEKAGEIALILLGKLMIKSNFNPRILKTIMKNTWKPLKRLVIKDLYSNLFLFQFFSEADKKYVIDKVPWAFDGKLLLIKEWTGMEQPSEIKFTTGI